jgi:undecaprenyl phosphate N,N'-diacetylbacillosamine 1-phosphate transferase
MHTYAAKRLLDVIAASVACALFAPVVVCIAAAILLTDGGPLFYPQQRVGRERQPFTVLKLRSMRGAEVTRIGRWLRRTGLDELPQLLAVWRGQMSMVGPRPLTEADIRRLCWDGPQLDWRFAVRPGITGLSQLLAGRGAGASRRLDRLYLARQSLTLDAQLIALSFAVNIIGKPRVRAWLRRGRP